MPITTRSLKAHELSNVLPYSSKKERAATFEQEAIRHQAALARLELAIAKAEESARTLDAEDKQCWMANVFQANG